MSRLTADNRLRVCGLFAGIGGIEYGLENAGMRSVRMCDVDPLARAVLGRHFASASLRHDVTRLHTLPDCEVLTAGFPCQDVSQAGLRAGIRGERFRLVEHVFRLFDAAPTQPRFLLLENVPGLLRLRRGEAMSYLAERFRERRLRWAYRTVDAQAFGIPQRRERVLILASATEDPAPILLGQDAGEPSPAVAPAGYGFYWTEGLRGLGLAKDSVPPLKGGFGLGIPSAPAVWQPDAPGGMAFGVPDIRDLERLQGLPENWTRPVRPNPVAERARWRLIGNAVCAAVSEWAGERIVQSAGDSVVPKGEEVAGASGWPKSGWATGDKLIAVDVSAFPIATPVPPIGEFLNHPVVPLSLRASNGFLERAWRSTLAFPPGLREALEDHAEHIRMETA